MTPRTQVPLFPNADASRLESLFSGMASAVEEGRLNEAVRLADCSCRIAPANPTCRVVHARLLIQLGASSEALERLGSLDEPDAVVARSEAFCLQGSADKAAASIEKLLLRYAINSVDGLRRLATQLCVPDNKHPGWIGADSSLRLCGGIRTGMPVAIAHAGKIYHPGISASGQEGMSSFTFDVPRLLPV